MSTQSPPPDAQAAKVEEDAETMPVSFVELFRFSGPADVLLMLTGSVASLALGALQPTQMVVFGAVIDTVRARACPGLQNGIPHPKLAPLCVP